MQPKAEEDPSKEYVSTLSSRCCMISSQMDQKMSGPRPGEARVNRSYRSDSALSYRRSGHPDITYKATVIPTLTVEITVTCNSNTTKWIRFSCTPSTVNRTQGPYWYPAAVTLNK